MPKLLRQVRDTVLIVCEGYAEECFVRHLRSQYLSRTGDLALTTQNARGRGGQHVLDHALRLRKRGSYDQVAMLADTDQDWDDRQRARARGYRIQVVESSPCLEAWLLEVNGHRPPDSSGQCKEDFLRVYGLQAHDPKVYERHFNRVVLDNARARIEALDQLLRLIRV